MKRGQLIAETLSFPNLPSAWNVTTQLPTYKVQNTYNDANQLTEAQTTVNGSAGYTTYTIYNSTNGWLTGIGKTSGSTNLATFSYGVHSEITDINYKTSSNGSLLDDHFTFDRNLRTTSDTASWQAGSGSSGNTFTQGMTYDAASNLITLATTQASVPGVNSSGGSETQVFCYDEQNRLLWGGNSGNATCNGNGTPAVSGSIAAYSNSFTYTNLGQLATGPFAGSGSYVYLYCNSAPHELTGLYPTGTTCPSPTGGVYTSSYDAYGNVISRTTTQNSTTVTDTMSYDMLDHMTNWSSNASGQTQQEQYVYDASGNRVLRRSTSGPSNSPTTTITTYAFGLEEHAYTSTGTSTGNLYYYFLGGKLIGSFDGTNTIFYLTDALGSIVSAFSNLANSAAVLGNQLFGPYGVSGTARYLAGSINTAKGFTGQYNDTLTGLDYFNARYYDPAVGVFLSADTAQGNTQGMNPYGYVNGNPETFSDPSGWIRIAATGAGSGTVSLQADEAYVYHYVTSNQIGSSGLPTLLQTYLYDHQTWILAESYAQNQMHSTTTLLLGEEAYMLIRTTHVNWNANDHTRLLYLILDGLALKMTETVAGLGVEGSPLASMEELERVVGESAGTLSGDTPVTVDSNGNIEGGPCSFTATTPVATTRGEQAISTLHIGDKVWAYNPKTHKMEMEPVLHVWINQDDDLVDLTLTTTKPDQHGKAPIRISETIHTNKKHPFLTLEKGFLPVGQITLGMHVLRADGTYGVVTGWKIVPGSSVMYNLEVAQDHTFTVGADQWVVHNASCPVKDLDPLHSPETSGKRPDLEKLSDQELLDSVYNPKDGRYMRIDPYTGRVFDGNGRAYELLRRAALPGSIITPDTPIYYEPYTPSSIPDPWEEPPF